MCGTSHHIYYDVCVSNTQELASVSCRSVCWKCFSQKLCHQVQIIDEITRGLVSTPMENMDQFVTGEITNHLFEERHIPHSGVDLIALNIQRGEACFYTAC
jgi:hypothetical protein